MRILLIGPLLANAGHGAEVGIYDALNSLDHEVEAWDYRAKQFIAVNGKPHHFEGMAESTVVEYGMILAPGPGLPNPILESVFFKSIKGPKVLWNSEPLRLQDYYNKMAAQKGVYDFVFTFDESEIFLYNKLGIDAKFLPQAYSPIFYKPLDDSVRSQARGVAFLASVGGKWSNRNHLVQRLRDARLPVGYGRVFDAERVNEIYNKSKLVLNLGLYCPQSGPPQELRAFGLQQRIFESIGAGRVCVTNEIPQDSNQLFDHNETILTYNHNNLEEIVEFGLDDDNRSRIESAISKIRHQHTYRARMETLLSSIES